MRYDGCELTGREKAGFWAGLLFCAAAVSVIFYNTLLPVPAAVLFYRPGKRRLEKVLCEKRRRTLRTEFCDFLHSVSASLATGRHMRDAMENARRELSGIYAPQDLIMKELDRMLRKMDRQGAAEPQVILELAERTGIEEIHEFAQAFLICRESGGDLVRAMTETARIIAEKTNIEGEIRRMSSQKRLEGQIITAMPILVILFLRFSSPEYIAVMYETWAGRVLMSLALAVSAGAFCLIERMTKIEV